MKNLIIVLSIVLIGLAAAAGSRYDIYALRPAPTTAYRVIGAVERTDGTFTWGSTGISTGLGMQFGTVNDTLSATGTYVVDIADTDTTLYQVFLTPVGSLGHNVNLLSVTDSTFTFKVWINDTAANVNILKVHWFLKEN